VLFELDAKIQTELLLRKTALVRRASQTVSVSRSNIEEEHAIDDAMYALHSPRVALKYRPRAKNASEDLAA
jgi:hypothetical protein